MAPKALTRETTTGAALEKVQGAIQSPATEVVPKPPSDLEELKADCDSFTFTSFTTEDAFVLGNLLYARLYPYAVKGKPTVISIALANTSQVVFQTVTGPGTAPDNEQWVRRKRNTVLRFGNSTWFMHNKFKGDEVAFAAKYGIADSNKGDYAIHGGAIPIRVQGVEGIVAVVVVSGLKQDEDHGVIADVIKNTTISTATMNTTKWRISKACQECRAKKIKCNGETPCQNCSMRNLSCVYREKARNRTRKVKPRTAAYETIMSHDAMESTSLEPSDEGTVPPTPNADDTASVGPTGSVMDSERSLTHNSVAATHRASPSCFLQLYYGPSSNFALLNSIYHQIAGTCPNDPPSRSGIVEEVGPGLDLFSHRRLFFGDLADNQRPSSIPDDCSAMLIDPDTAHRLLERYLLTYWHGLPIMSKDHYRRRLSALYQPPGIFDYDAPETIIIMLAVGLGASMTGEEAIADFLFQKTKQGVAKLDEVVNMQMLTQSHAHFQSERARPNSGFLHVGTACRKAVAAGLHKDGCSRPGYTEDDTNQRRITFWSLFFWETWQCFVLGRPSSLPDPGSIIPLPKGQKLLKSLVTLSRIMDKCVKKIYSPRHDSLLPVWNAAIEIRRELHQFAEQQLKDMKFGLVGDPSTGELGVCQAMVSTMYHHTLLLTFRPFLILRAKLNHDRAAATSAENLQMPPPWLDSACEYCLEAARNSVGFLTGSCATNILCRVRLSPFDSESESANKRQDIKYHGFFMEGACYALAFDMLQEKKTAHRNLPWIHSGLRCLRSMMGSAGVNAGQLPITIASIEQMVRSAGFELKDPVDTNQQKQTPQSTLPGSPAPVSVAGGMRSEPAFTFPSMPFGFDVTGQMNGSSSSPAGAASEDMADFTAADVGWDIDFGTMNMEAFLSLDSAEAFNFAP
ncbi:hypothetical protein FPANT_7663 [Fusarium pseudoanthophilum]|uniref:Zn(2)-C6 fungal-type domain-containing protein n=1 Tax=Fusarium pseudoanthophilum TaxID=48495 RepID=A0A8H5L262_9HYPO|nr:hypothetical protein FPANT_7663 [Fusarium pseudoanthophilum]